MPADERMFPRAFPIPRNSGGCLRERRQPWFRNLIESPIFLTAHLQFFCYGFDVTPNLSNRIGYFFFCFSEAFAPLARQSWRGYVNAISTQRRRVRFR